MKKIIIALLVATLGCTTISAQKPQKATSPATQCIATTKKGTRCKLEVDKGSKYCIIHNPQIKKCKAKTKSGNKCSRYAQEGSDYCWQHQKKH